MSLLGEMFGQDLPERSRRSSSRRSRSKAKASTQATSHTSPSPGRGFRAIFSAEVNSPRSRLIFLIAAIAFWTAAGAAIVRAFDLSIAPLSKLGDVGVTDYDWLDINWSDVSALNWYGVSWLSVLMYLFAAWLAYWLGSFPMRAWKRLRRRHEGVIGNGIRVLPDGTVELGVARIRPASFKGVSETVRARIDGVRWKRLASFAGEREILINLMQTEERGPMVGHMILKVAGDLEAMFLTFLDPDAADRSSLWVTKGSEVIELDRVPLDAQLEAVSSVLAPVLKRKDGVLALTYTEFEPDAGEPQDEDAAVFDEDEDEGDETAPDSETDTLQEKANELLAANALPPAVSQLAGIVSKYGYKLKPNPDANRFREL